MKKKILFVMPSQVMDFQIFMSWKRCGTSKEILDLHKTGGFEIKWTSFKLLFRL